MAWTDYFKAAVDAADMVKKTTWGNWRGERPEQNLECLSAVLRLATLLFYPEGTRMAIRHDRIELQASDGYWGWGQCVSRVAHGDDCRDLFALESVISTLCKGMAIHEAPYTSFARLAKKGLEKQHALYQKKLVSLANQGKSTKDYRDILEKISFWMTQIQEALDEPLHMKPAIHASVVQNWDIKEIELVDYYLRKLEYFSKNGLQSDKQKSHLEAIENILSLKETGAPLTSEILMLEEKVFPAEEEALKKERAEMVEESGVCFPASWGQSPPPSPLRPQSFSSYEREIDPRYQELYQALPNVKQAQD